MPTMEYAHIETQTVDSDLDVGGGGGGARWSIWRRVDPMRYPLLILIRGAVYRFGVVCLLNMFVIGIGTAGGLAWLEGLPPWVPRAQAAAGVLVTLGTGTFGALCMFVGSRASRTRGAGILALLLSFIKWPVAIVAFAVWGALWVGNARMRRRQVDPYAVRFGLDRAGCDRVGLGCLLAAALWIAAVRTGLPYRLHIGMSVDTAVWGGVTLCCLAMLFLLWTHLPAPKRPYDPWTESRDRMARMAAAPRPPLVTPSHLEPARLADLVLPDATRAELDALIRLLREPEAARAAGITVPRGAILYGPPGTGKTLIARAIAGECGLTALAFTGAAVSSKWVGESTERIQDMFRQAREAAPCVLVLDELDGIAPSRQGDPVNSVAGRDFAQRINEILQQLEGVGGAATGVFVVGATNHLDAVDPAVRSRLSYHLAVPLPDEPARAALLRQTFPANTDTSPEEVARFTQGLSGRDLRELCSAASLAAFAAYQDTVTRAHFETALARIGAEPGAHGTREAETTRMQPAALSDLVLPEPILRELRTFIALLRDPDRGKRLGARVPAGAILYGPPGTGKTLIARAIATELGRQGLAFSGASLTSVVAGEGVQLIRSAFRQARQQAPCVMFVDELDGAAPARDGGLGGLGSSQDAVQKVNQFLQELEGVGGRLSGVCVIGATNRLEAIDEAVRSRLSYHLEIPLPDLAARAAILRRHWPESAAVTPDEIAVMTDGLSGRGLRDLCETAGMIAVSEGADAVTAEHFRRALERVARTA